MKKIDNIHFTFDDGPNCKYTLQILDILKNYEIKATFFLIGKNVEYYPHIAKKIVKGGHNVGNHTYNHKRLTNLSKKSILDEIEEAEFVYKNILGIKPRLFRPPYGKYNANVEEILTAKGYELMLWDACANDWENPHPDYIVKRIVSQIIKPNSIILLHDGANIRHGESRQNTVNSLPLLIQTLYQNSG